jgi:hypothetical protein
MVLDGLILDVSLRGKYADKFNCLGLLLNLRLTLQKKTLFFAMERCFLLTGVF